MGQKIISHSKHWSWKEAVLLLLVTIAFVPFFIEFLLHDFLYFVFQNRLYSGTLTGLVMAVVFTFSLYIIALRPKRLSWDCVGIRLFPKYYWKWIGVWTLVLIFFSVIILTIMEWMNIGWENEKTDSLLADISWFPILIAFISAAIISPIYEEIFYRGFLYQWFRVKWGIGAGLVISSIIFTIVHIPTYNTLPINFISGLVFAWTYEKTGSILPAMIIHATFNGIAVLLTVLS